MNIRRILSQVPVLGQFQAAPVATRPSGPTMAGDRLSRSGPRAVPARVLTGFEQLPPANGQYGMGNGETLIVRNARSKPPAGPGLTVMTFNVYLGGKKRSELDSYLEGLEQAGRLPDVIALQETRQGLSAELAQKLGYHLVYVGREKDAEGRLLNGKAILTRYPVEEATHYTYAISDAERDAAIRRKGKSGEINEDRGALRLTMRVDGRAVDIFNVHQTLGDATINAEQTRQLASLVQGSRQQGREAVVVGDFNVNTNIREEGSWLDAHRGAYDATDTAEEYQARYGSWLSSLGDGGVGNAGDKSVQDAFRALERVVPSSWDRAERVQTRRPNGELMSPEEARERLNSGRVARGSEAWKRLQDIADSATLSLNAQYAGVEASGKRFDNLYATPGLTPESLEIDRTSEASDHQPVIARYSWK
jgi:endonuclease/exonuclease/phosphatase family metal-dependent hydrolase